MILAKRTEKIVRKLHEIEPDLDSSRKLDIGCGDCLITSRLVETTGIDLYDQRKAMHKDFLTYDGKNLPFPDDSFDISLLLFTLHHTDNPARLLKEARRISGKIIVMEDTYVSDFQYRFLCLYDNLTNRMLSRYKRIDLYYNFLTDKRWKQVFRKLGLKLVRQYHKKYWFLPFTYSVYVLE